MPKAGKSDNAAPKILELVWIRLFAFPAFSKYAFTIICFEISSTELTPYKDVYIMRRSDFELFAAGR